MTNQFNTAAIVRSFAGVSGLYFVGIPLLLIANIILARTLSVSEYGTFGFVISMATVLAIPVSGGLTLLLTREVAGYVQKNNWAAYRGVVFAAYFWVLLACSAIGLLYFIWTILLGNIPNEQLIISFLLVPLLALNAIRQGILRGLGCPVLAEAPSQIFQPALIIIGYLSLTWLGLSTSKFALWWYLTAVGIVFCLASVMLWRVQPTAVREAGFDTSDNSRWKRAFFPLMLMSAATLLGAQIAIIISGFMGQEEVVAYLRVAERGAIVIIIPFHILGAIVGPHLVDAINHGGIGKQKAVIQQSARLMLITSLPIGIVIVFAGAQILKLLFGTPYDQASYLPMVIVSVTQIASMSFGHIGILLTMAGREKLILASQLVALSVNVSLCLILIGPYGAVGASLAVSAGVVASTLMNVTLVKYHFGFVPGIFGKISPDEDFGTTRGQ